MDVASLNEKISEVQSQIKVKEEELGSLVQLLQKYHTELNLLLKEKPPDSIPGNVTSPNPSSDSVTTSDLKLEKNSVSNTNVNRRIHACSSAA